MGQYPSAGNERTLEIDLLKKERIIGKYEQTIQEYEITIRELGDTVLNQGRLIEDLENDLLVMRTLHHEALDEGASGIQSSVDSLSSVSDSEEEHPNGE